MSRVRDTVWGRGMRCSHEHTGFGADTTRKHGPLGMTPLGAPNAAFADANIFTRNGSVGSFSN